jgi:hypothetical protein
MLGDTDYPHITIKLLVGLGSFMSFSSFVGLRPDKNLRHGQCDQFVIAHNLCTEFHDFLATFRKRKK